MKLSFMTLNLWEGGRLRSDIKEFLRTQQPDIIGLQEAYESPDQSSDEPLSLSILQNQLGYEYCDFAPAMLDRLSDRDVLNGNGILSRFPIVSSRTTFFDQPFGVMRDPTDAATFPTTPRNLQHAAIETPDGLVNVFNFQGVWDLDGDNDSPARRRMVRIILQNIDDKANIILAGDTNARPTNPAMRPLNHRLTNVFDNELTTTFNMRHKDNPGYASSVVDMIFVSPEIIVDSHICHSDDVSDHLALSIQFEIHKD